jgi:hypothetical protein
MLVDELLGERDEVLRLIAVKPDGLDLLSNALLAERDDLLRRVACADSMTAASSVNGSLK